MGLLPQVVERSLPMPDRFFTLGGDTGREIVHVPFDLEKSNSAGARCIDRSTFMNILLDQIHEQGVELVYGKRLHTLEQTPKAVEVTFTDGTKARGDVLIGAEGRRSPTRSHLFPQRAFRGLMSPSPQGLDKAGWSGGRWWAMGGAGRTIPAWSRRGCRG
ncbi:FAD-dependent oxidoreductase [Streptomonospora salina]|uniref:2-polyprenyl-6-methoxyphenol hydroxylase-like FAD-dependent oxidoreductase n=1 Tax=Streptomonospora salina TaxID=104205 RepID=A0A841E4X6_9ACTN|nr:hypothetical protein [Streptomonospora salina]MBB5996258.1 2-polyprenyl-6-methoxyphenol hydroxylase-like FAD-dependent oxidoreductase [Streptomonospora salina]